MMYVSLIGDIVKSKTMSRDARSDFQNNLEQTLKECNEKYKEFMAAEMTITLGDEFQGLFINAIPTFEIIAYLQAKFPISIRYGIGIGELYTEIKNSIAIGSDGPVWWKARNAITDIENTYERTGKGRTNILISGLSDPLTGELVNNTLILAYHISSKWTKKQKDIIQKIIMTYGLESKFKQKDLAEKYAIDPSKLNRAISNSRYTDYIGAIKNIARIINQEIGKGDNHVQ